MNASFPMYGNVTFNININVPPSHGTSSQMNPHDYLEAMQLAFGLSGNGLTNPAQSGGQGMYNASHFQQPPPGHSFAPFGNDYPDIASLTSGVGEMHLNEYTTQCQPTEFSHYDNITSANTQFESLQFPETPRWLPSGSRVSQSPLP
ncbi:hypothetical protein NMY22_g10364 [Coprinellus aureogranulatus]|nr:hypothetical protein NMY22_g10364 [Coprinellus aureogranulatus]